MAATSCMEASYEYFRNEALDANDANLKAVGEGRPEMRRNVYGATMGGPLRKNTAFFFVSYQGTREANGATDQSLYKDVLIAPGLTDDRSTATLMNTFGVPSIDPISLKLLNVETSKRPVSDSHARRRLMDGSRARHSPPTAKSNSMPISIIDSVQATHLPASSSSPMLRCSARSGRIELRRPCQPARLRHADQRR